MALESKPLFHPEVSDDVNQAYGPTPVEIDLMRKIAPPHMPSPQPATTPQTALQELAGSQTLRLLR